MGGFAWVTLATNDSYSLGALVLAHSLRRAGTIHQLAVLVTPGVTPAMRDRLASVFNSVTEVNILDSKDAANLAFLGRPHLGVTFTKLHCWRLTQYDKCCFLDADTLVVQNCDELAEREEFSAAPDVGWPDCFNSGVFVYRPSIDTFNSLMQFAVEKGSFDGGDQGLLNLYFKDWAHKDISKHLPFIYNVCSTATYSYLPAFKQYGADLKIIHFIGASKPWHCYLDSQTKVVSPPGEFGHVQALLQFWWDVFCQNVHASLSSDMHVDRSFFQAPHSHPTHHEPPPALPTHNDPSSIFSDPWDHYLEQVQYERQRQQQREQWLQIVEKDERQSGRSILLINESSLLINESSSQSSQDSGPQQHHFEISSCFEAMHAYHNSPSQTEHILPHTEQHSPSSPQTQHILPHTEQHTPSSSHTDLLSSSLVPIEPVHKTTDLADGHSDIGTTAGLAGALSQMTLGEPRSPDQSALEDHLRKQSWEQGHIDYMGRDSFENIWSKVMQTITGVAPSPAAAPTEPSAAVPAPVAAPAQTEPSVPASAPDVLPSPAVPSPPASAPAVAPSPAAPSPPASDSAVAPPPVAPSPPASTEAVAVAPSPAVAPPPAPAAAAAPPTASAPAPIALSSAAPQTPTVTTPTPPTSPPVLPGQTSPEGLKVDPTPPGTPPAGAQASEPPGSGAPVPPKRKGSGSGKGDSSGSYCALM